MLSKCSVRVVLIGSSVAFGLAIAMTVVSVVDHFVNVPIQFKLCALGGVSVVSAGLGVILIQHFR